MAINFDNILSTTLEKRSGMFADAVSKTNALLAVLKDSDGGIKLEDGGVSIVKEIASAENGTFQFYSGDDVLNIADSQILTAAQYEWKQAAVTVRMNGREMRQNSGSDTKVMDLMEQKIKVAVSTMANNISTSLYSDGTGAGGQEIGGLALLVADSPLAGTVGGINRAVDAFWRNKEVNALGYTSSTIQGFMSDLWIKTVRGSDRPTVIIAGENAYSAYRDSLTNIARLEAGGTGIGGFESLEFAGTTGTARVVLDTACPTDKMYFLNTNHLNFTIHKDANFAAQESQGFTDRDAIVKTILFQGNLTMSNAALQGVLHV